MIALAMTYNGRKACLEETLGSLREHLGAALNPDRHGSRLISRCVLVDDSGDGTLPPYDGFIIVTHGQNLGMARTVQDAWTAALTPGIQYVLHWEDDMRAERDVPLAAALHVLRRHRNLAQVCFQRHPVSGEEHAHGGQLAARIVNGEGRYAHGVTITDDLFSLNPCLIPRRVCELGWPEGPIGVGNEDGFTAKCKAAGLEFATYGTVHDAPYVTHIGGERAPAWQL